MGRRCVQPLVETSIPSSMATLAKNRIMSLFGYTSKVYEKGWFVGEIIFLNTSLMEYKAVFTDDTIDFISINDLVDNAEIVLME